MPTQRLFDACPEFPADIPVVPAVKISFDELEDGDVQASKKVWQACREHGYFLLDLKTSVRGEKLLNAAETMFDVATQTFELGSKVLDPYKLNLPKDLQGYKRAGVSKTDYGERDAIEFYTINQDDLTGLAPSRPKPEALANRTGDCLNFVRKAYDALAVVMRALDKELDLPVGTLASLCSVEKASKTNLRFTQARTLYDTDGGKDSEVKFGGHTDIGAITMLFNVVGGLQILPAGSANVNENWLYIRPEPGCAIVQMADAMVEWTGGLLRSNLHRVYHPPGAQANATRLSLAYLVRPSDDASMRRLTGSSVIPPLAEGEEDEMRSPTEWAIWRNFQIMHGNWKPATRGGAPITAPITAGISSLPQTVTA